MRFFKVDFLQGQEKMSFTFEHVENSVVDGFMLCKGMVWQKMSNIIIDKEAEKAKESFKNITAMHIPSGLIFKVLEIEVSEDLIVKKDGLIEILESEKEE